MIVYNVPEKITLDHDKYLDRMQACWIGKNIGGTMGTPYEGTKEYLDIQGFVTKPGEVLPNDDLDLQLLWLKAVKRFGPYDLDCKKLGEYWQSFTTPNWNEYGIGKLNMARGMYPPLSGDYDNSWRDSNGAWIRTEIWACLCPGLPDLAAHYAIEDAMVDHGVGEGTIAAAFVAAMEAAAFTLPDLRSCIELGLSRIPAASRTAISVRLAMECYDKELTPKKARETIRLSNSDIGDGWFEAPSNVAYTVLGLLYGEGDFKRSMITAINCGDDTDCTGATVGAMMGLLYGLEGIPKDWREYIGDAIVTCSLNTTLRTKFPKTTAELSRDVDEMAPIVMFASRQMPDDQVCVFGERDEIPADVKELYAAHNKTLPRLEALAPYSFTQSFGPLCVTVTHAEAPELSPLGSASVSVRLENPYVLYGNLPYNLSVDWILPEGFSVSGPKALRLLHHTKDSRPYYVTADYEITAGEEVDAVNEVILVIKAEGRVSEALVPLHFMGV